MIESTLVGVMSSVICLTILMNILKLRAGEQCPEHIANWLGVLGGRVASRFGLVGLQEICGERLLLRRGGAAEGGPVKAVNHLLDVFFVFFFRGRFRELAGIDALIKFFAVQKLQGLDDGHVVWASR